MMVLPFAFIPFILRFPTGLVLYWMTTNLWTVGQGLITRRLIPKVAPPTTPKRSSRTAAKEQSDDASSSAPAAAAKPNPGRPAVYRLNRFQYANAIRDLIDLEVDSASLLPADDAGYGFDNIGDVLSISPLLMEKYLAAAEQVAQVVILTPETGGRQVRLEKETLAAAGGTDFGTARLLTKAEELRIDHVFPKAGAYRLRARA